MTSFTQGTLGDGELMNASKWWWRVLKPLSDLLSPWLGDLVWQNATLLGAWTNNAGTSWYPLQYRVRGGVLWLRGTATGGAFGSNIFALPVGYRPSAGGTVIITCYGSAGTLVRIGISTSGTVVYQGTISNTVGAVWFDGASVVVI